MTSTAREIVLDLPAAPSTNRTRRIDWSFYPAAEAWKRAADKHVLLAKCRAKDPLPLERISQFELHITVSEQHTRVDLDGGLKFLIDYLRRIELIEDDGPKHMRRLVVEWGEAPEGCRVTIKPIGSAS